MVVLGTRATVNSDAYRRSLHGISPGMVVESIACPLFVPLVEEGLTSESLTQAVLSHYLGHLLSAPPDIVLLGCTHYPLLMGHLKSYLPASVRIVDSASACASYATQYLKEKGLAASPRNIGGEKFYVTDLSSDFYNQASRFLGHKIAYVEKSSVG